MNHREARLPEFELDQLGGLRLVLSQQDGHHAARNYAGIKGGTSADMRGLALWGWQTSGEGGEKWQGRTGSWRLHRGARASTTTDRLRKKSFWLKTMK